MPIIIVKYTLWKDNFTIIHDGEGGTGAVGSPPPPKKLWFSSRCQVLSLSKQGYYQSTSWCAYRLNLTQLGLNPDVSYVGRIVCI